MTLSIVAFDERTGQAGAAALTYMLGVGKLVTWVRPGVGAAVTQAFPNPYLALDGFELLVDGRDARQALDIVLAGDPKSEGRQVALVDAAGRTAAFTGEAPQDWKGHRTDRGFSVQGNRLTGPAVLDAMAEAFRAQPERELVQRLLDALRAGEREGGDRKGHRSASVEVYGVERYPLWELRVDYADAPLDALQETYRIVRGDLWPEVQRMPTRADPGGDFDFGDDRQTA